MKDQDRIFTNVYCRHDHGLKGAQVGATNARVQWMLTHFTSREVTGIVELTMLRGTVIAKDREVIGKMGYGEYIPGTPQ